jgi:membrane protease YdiL (CAAX protease family)
MPLPRPAALAGAARARSYWALSRAPRYALLFALPLLVLYEGLAAALGGLAGVAVRNGADVWLKAPFVAVFGPRGPVVFGALVVLASVALVLRDVRRSRDGVRAGVFARMLGESVLLAGVCALAVGMATAQLLRALPHAVVAVAPALAASPGGVASLGAPAQLMVSLGAGLYEELLFRVVLVGALRAGARRVLGLGPAAAALLAVVVGAVLFSAAHHVGPLGDPLTADRFVFRLVAGLFFSGVYVLRGFGIAAWAHALYDVGVLTLT